MLANVVGELQTKKTAAASRSS